MDTQRHRENIESMKEIKHGDTEAQRKHRKYERN